MLIFLVEQWKKKEKVDFAKSIVIKEIKQTYSLQSKKIYWMEE